MADLLDWQVIGDTLRKTRANHRTDKRGNNGYASLKMFKAVLLGQWLMKGDLLKHLMGKINSQLEQQNLKIRNATIAVVDASIIESIGAPKRKALEVQDNGDITPTPASKDKEATWVKKAGRFYLGYKLHASSDEEGYLEGIHVTCANAHESQH